MKTVKWTFGLANYGRDSGPQVLKLQTTVKAFGGLIAASTYVKSSEANTLIVMLVIGVVHELVGCLRAEEIVN